MATHDGRSRLTTGGACVDRQAAVELGNQWHQLSLEKVRATRAGDTVEAERLRGELRAVEAAIREQYTGCQHPPKGDQQKQNKGVEPSVRDEAAHTGTGDRADPELAARMDAALDRANTALARGQHDLTARQPRQCTQPTRTPPRTTCIEPEQPGLSL